MTGSNVTFCLHNIFTWFDWCDVFKCTLCITHTQSSNLNQDIAHCYLFPQWHHVFVWFFVYSYIQHQLKMLYHYFKQVIYIIHRITLLFQQHKTMSLNHMWSGVICLKIIFSPIYLVVSEMSISKYVDKIYICFSFFLFLSAAL